MLVHRIACCVVFALALLLPCSGKTGELVVVVNAGSGVGRLNRDQVINIFLGRLRQYPSGLAAEPIDQPGSSVLRQQFYRLLVEKEVAEIDAYWARLIFSGRTLPPQRAKDGEDVHRLLAAKPGGIAYIERSEVTSRMVVVHSLGHEQ